MTDNAAPRPWRKSQSVWASSSEKGNRLGTKCATDFVLVRAHQWRVSNEFIQCMQLYN